MIYKEYFESPVGWMEIMADDTRITSVLFKGQVKEEPYRANALTTQCADELRDYFRGVRKKFGVPVAMDGTPFQQKVWQAVCDIPYGNVLTYHRLAELLQRPQAVRAAGTANGRNKILVVIPCHRVIGADGNLVGYAGELWRKKWLLEHEAKHSGRGQMVLEFKV